MNPSLSIEQIAGRTIIVRADSTNPAQIIRSRGATDIRNQTEYTLQEAPATTQG